MRYRCLKLSVWTVTAFLAACSRDVTAPTTAVPGGISRAVSSLPVINVSTIDSLYAVVNNPIYAGRDVRLTPNVYVLDPSRPFGGRLQLQQDMTLRGKAGYGASVIIDASQLQTAQFMDGTLLTGAIRAGRGRNTIESLTIRNAVFGSAGIETDLVGTGPTEIRIAHVIATGNVRGIQVRNVGAPMANRALIVELSDNELIDNTVGIGAGLSITNRPGATGATIDATIDNNKARGNITGCLVANANVSGASITVDSHADRFEGNGNGCVILGGNGTANNNTVSFRAQSSRFVNNGAAGFPAPAVDSGGILAVGAVGSSGASGNTVVIDLWGILFQNNRYPDIAAFAVQADPGSPGTGNGVTVMLHGMSNDAIVNPPLGSALGTNTVTVIRY